MILLFFSLLLNLQTPTWEGAKLEKLVQERDQLHAEWKASESKKTGIFGNRTKKDMIETHEWLERILAKDNQIMDELRLSGDIETEVITQEKDDYKAITLKLEQDVQALKRAIAEKDKELETQLADRRTFELASLIFFLSTLGLGWWVFKVKSKK